MGENNEYKLWIRNCLEGIPIMYILGISGRKEEIPPDKEEYEIEIGPDGILTMWLNPGSAELQEEIPYTVKEKVSPNGPEGNHTIQIIRHYGIPTGAEQNTPIWKIFWANLGPITTQEGPSVRQHVNVTVGDPP